MTAERVSVSRLKARLSEWLGRVRAGKTVIVTDRGKPVARLEPVSWDDDPDGHLAALVAAGLARRPLHKLGAKFFDGPRVKDPTGQVLRALLAERESGR
ncbi:MAG: type II toxin-antitoxin system prevent-host-death family antitoxin [Gemmataceae bacterium]|nr:type II toxin-antitoxin system prevent-host-death family antitoxin [Gemmataceae bacterium]